MAALYEGIEKKEIKLSIIGLGYVGMPLAIAFAKVANVIGFDISRNKVEEYRRGIDVTNEVGNMELADTSAYFTWEEKYLQDAKFHIVAVPTPINKDKTPDLTPLISASRTLGRNLTKDSIVVFESTVYPGVTEDVCVPILEELSNLKCGVDFKVGYSPERINPGDKLHRLETIVKVVAGMDEDSLEQISKIYGLVIEAGVYKAESIKVAEAAKVIENSQRDINIAFMNELSIIFNKLGIDTQAVLKAAGTKWNFLNFSPGLVGGHCIGVDPYYLTYKAEEVGYHSQIILSGRRINDGMGKYVAENVVKNLITADLSIHDAKVAILGFTFKEDCPDTRNSKVIDIVNELKEYKITPVIYDPTADSKEAEREYGITFTDFQSIEDVDAIVIAVSHREFLEMNLSDFDKLFKNVDNQKKIIIDVKAILNRKEIEDLNYRYWRL
ncbi:UDP-N-acetyl-D-galactosamine dehydrogenase [Bacillus sp. FJAT-27264]|uniref:nucleotide sugar dehydrogenase n=1 Tax=Paenibacillus sp. (strain DSM 101736 / FJAT-27264) TaxID=1850362 RepID=UPI000807C54B|nr:nucleotide sugar dehydrogenase [Bacillus sp. FJAT-27264]OBZ09818.1 UDP-N-acetyl-D-galactosamine dehydrogenase [Bacillus sp. FJAT-27264]